MIYLSIVLSSTIVIEIDIFVYIFYTITCHLKNRKNECLIVGCLDPTPISMFHVLLFDFCEDAHREGAHVAKFLAYESVIFVFDLSDVVRTGVAFLEVVFMKMTVEVISICYCWLFGLINCI